MSFHKIKTLFLLGVEDLFKNMNVFVYVYLHCYTQTFLQGILNTYSLYVFY